MGETVLRSGMLVFPNLTQLDLTGRHHSPWGVPAMATVRARRRAWTRRPVAGGGLAAGIACA